MKHSSIDKTWLLKRFKQFTRHYHNGALPVTFADGLPPNEVTACEGSCNFTGGEFLLCIVVLSETGGLVISNQHVVLLDYGVTKFMANLSELSPLLILEDDIKTVLDKPRHVNITLQHTVLVRNSFEFFFLVNFLLRAKRALVLLPP
jgi:hypothetical protein